ncbi:MAG: hypothetical protein JNM81_16345 [Rhodospirillaceae bacterium]|nr:hypothetical protein [Rhodospirillaceae bacterium]
MNHLSKLRRWLHDHLPDSAWARAPIGVLLIILGCLGFLPVLGFWMIPVGLFVLAIDFPPARRLGRWLVVKVGRKIQPKTR